jgi:hypothetical protein
MQAAQLFRVDSDFAIFAAERSPFAPQAFSAGIVLFLRATACGMISAVFVLTTDPGHFVKALMANWRLSPRVGYALFSALHLVPDLAGELRQIRIARAMKRGKPPSAFLCPSELVTLFVPLLAYAIRRGTGSDSHGGSRPRDSREADHRRGTASRLVRCSFRRHRALPYGERACLRALLETSMCHSCVPASHRHRAPR